MTSKNNKFYFAKSSSDEDDFIQILIPKSAFELKSLSNEIKKSNIEKKHYTEANYPFTIKPNFLTLATMIELSFQGPVISFVPDDSIRDLSGYNATTIYEEYNLSPNPVDLLSFDNNFLECDAAQGKISRGKRSVRIHNLTIDVDTGYKYIENFCGGVQGYMMESKDFVSSICFKLKNENSQLVSFNRQSITFLLSTKEIYFSTN